MLLFHPNLYFVALPSHPYLYTAFPEAHVAHASLSTILSSSSTSSCIFFCLIFLFNTIFSLFSLSSVSITASSSLSIQSSSLPYSFLLFFVPQFLFHFPLFLPITMNLLICHTIIICFTFLLDPDNSFNLGVFVLC